MAYFNQTSEGSSPMDKVKKILSSPMARKKNQQPVQPKYFGVPLENILQREGTDIPHLVIKICSFLLKNGVSQEGIFRVNGNAKVIERIKQSFETSGDANLDNAGDVMAVAAVLKMFFRQLPDGLIPETETLEFVRIQEAYKSNKEACQHHMRAQLSKLSRPQYVTLRYLCTFLVEVTKYEANNKMNPMALGIVFGPNIFRCSLGIQGLKEQGITNHITLKFIQDYDLLFPQDTPSPKISQNGRKKPAPPRPPPPKVDDSPEVMQPVSVPRKVKQQRYDSSTYHDSEDTGSVQSSDTRTTPRYSDDEFVETGRLSPFPLETDRSEYSTHTSFMNTSNTEAVEKAINSAITEHLFGDGNGSVSSEEAPIRPPRRKIKSQYDNMEESYEPIVTDDNRTEDTPVNIKQRIQQFESDRNGEKGTSEMTGPMTRKQPQSKAFQMFEEKGLVIGLAPSNLNLQTLKYGGDGAEIAVESDESSQPSTEETPKAAPRVNKRTHQNDDYSTSETSLPGDELGFNGVPRAQETLSSFKKPAGPRNRRNPTRRSLKGEINEENSNTEESPTPPPSRPRGFLIENDNFNDNTNRATTNSDVNHNNAAKPSTSFLNIHFNGTGDRNGSPEKSPSIADKPFVPPLDLSILHEHGDGSEPIPVNQGLSISLHKVQPDSTQDKAIISPRSDKKTRDDLRGPMSPSSFRVIAFSSLQHDPEIPPSPPMEQTKKRVHRVEDEFSVQVKTLTKKIQTCKRKIKSFEETFESDHGYRPSQTDKAARPEIKKYMQDLARTRKELRKIKEDQEQQRLLTSPGTGGSSAGEDGPPTMKETLHVLMKRLIEKRKDGNRPEDLLLMNSDQIQEEKLAVQKALLHFESLHGRPATKSEKELMRPLYDRYRNIKRLLAKAPFSPSDKSKDSLQTVPEDHTIEFDAHSAKSTFSNRDPIRIPTAEPEEMPEDRDTFLVTKDFRLMADTVKPLATTSKGGGIGFGGGGGGGGVGSWINEPLKENVLHSPVRETNKNLHEMTYSQLLEEQNRVKNEKKRLRKILREFEDDFYEQKGEKVQKEDRAPMDVEYREYKQIKARLKLLEALISKHGNNSDL